MSKWGEEGPIHKAKKTGQLDAAKSGGRGKRKPKPWKVMAVFLGSEFVAYRGADEAACKKWLEKTARLYFVRRQDQSERAIEESKSKAARRALQYRIEAPK